MEHIHLYSVSSLYTYTIVALSVTVFVTKCLSNDFVEQKKHIKKVGQDYSVYLTQREIRLI